MLRLQLAPAATDQQLVSDSGSGPELTFALQNTIKPGVYVMCYSFAGYPYVRQPAVQVRAFLPCIPPPSLINILWICCSRLGLVDDIYCGVLGLVSLGSEQATHTGRVQFGKVRVPCGLVLRASRSVFARRHPVPWRLSTPCPPCGRL